MKLIIGAVIGILFAIIHERYKKRKKYKADNFYQLWQERQVKKDSKNSNNG